jgi:hypothetical protein
MVEAAFPDGDTDYVTDNRTLHGVRHALAHLIHEMGRGDIYPALPGLRVLSQLALSNVDQSSLPPVDASI